MAAKLERIMYQLRFMSVKNNISRYAAVRADLESQIYGHLRRFGVSRCSGFGRPGKLHEETFFELAGELA